MDVLIWIGALITIIGLAGVIYSMVRVIRIRKAGYDEENLRTELGKVVPINLGAFLFSVLGLMCVVVGIVLG